MSFIVANESTNNEAIDTMLKSLTILSSEVIERRIDMEKIKSLIKQGKKRYNTEIKNYNTITKDIIELEKSIELIENQTAKMKTKQNLLMISVTKDFFKNCQEIIQQTPLIIINGILQICGFERDSLNLENRIFHTVIKDENELKILIENSERVQVGYHNINENLFKEIKEDTEAIMKESVSYPFDVFFEYFKLVYDIIQHNEKKEELIHEIDMQNQMKNGIFLGLKTLEAEIMANDETYNSLGKHIKGINNLLNNYKQLKLANSSLDTLLVFASKVKDFKHFNTITYDRFDIMNSLTVQSEYSEDRSDLSSLAEKRLMKDNKSAVITINPTLASSTMASTVIVAKNNNNKPKETSSKEVTKIKSMKRVNNNRNSLNKSHNSIDNTVHVNTNNSNNGNNNPITSVVTPIKKQKMNVIDYQKIVTGDSKSKPKQREKAKSKSEINIPNPNTIQMDNPIQIKTSAQDDGMMIPSSPMIDMMSYKDIDSVCEEIEASGPIKNISQKRTKIFSYGSNNQSIPNRKNNLKDMGFLLFEKPVSSNDCCVACT